MEEVTRRIIRIRSAPGVLHVFSPFELLEDARTLGAKWNKKERSWDVCATVGGVRRIIEVFGHHEIAGDQGYKDLLSAVRVASEATYCKEASVEELEQPEVRGTQAWLHQVRGYHFARRIKACLLAMAMGTGKSKTAIDIMQNSGGSRFLILCPKSVVGVWPDEISRHAAKEWNPAVLSLDKGSVKKRMETIKKKLDAARDAPAIVVLNYESAWREPMASLLLSTRWNLVIFDESHRIKAPQGKASKFCASLFSVSDKRIGLTGTPLPHSPLDAFGQFRALDPGIFGKSFASFRARYAVMGGFGGHEVRGFQNTKDFYEKFYSITYRVSKDVLDLPESTHVTRKCELEPAARKVYKSLESDFWAGIGAGEITATNALVKLIRLAQLTGGTLLTDDGKEVEVSSAKKALLGEVMEDMEIEEPVVVFARFRKDLDRIAETAAKLGRKSYELSGRRNELKLWQEDTTGSVLAVQEQAGGVGISLVRARYCIYYSVGYSLGDYEQSLARIHRPGQSRGVLYVHLLAEQSIDEAVYAALDARRDVVEAILEGRTKGEK